MNVRERAIEFFYPGLESLGVSLYDSSVTFYSHVDNLLPTGSTMLDYGAGRGCEFETQEPSHHSFIWPSHKLVRRIGCDVDPIVFENRIVHEAHLLEASDNFRIPLPDESCDCVLLDWVVEHLPNPIASFTDIHRVLKPGGSICIRTSNWFHYSYLLASLVDGTKLERAILKIAQPNRLQEDIFPKLYRANSRRKLRRLLVAADFRTTTTFTWDTESVYMNFSTPSVIIGGLYHRLAMAGLLPRAILMGFATKASRPGQN